MIAYAELESWPHMFRASAGARNRRKANVKIRRNQSPGVIRLDPGYLFQLETNDI